jgi:hypothetical protein
MHRALLAAVAVIAILGVAGCGGGGDSSAAPATLVCVDSTHSTSKVRASYLPDLKSLASRAASEAGPFYVASCGSNATGTVRWPIHQQFARDSFLSGELAAEQAESEAKRATPQLERLVEVTSSKPGTPLGEMLSVAAGQCEAANRKCKVYIFTDGEWADGLLRVRGGVDTKERERYLHEYVPRLGGLAGASVWFVGVGYGTQMGALRLGEAEEVARLLVEEAGGRFEGWSVRLTE